MGFAGFIGGIIIGLLSVLLAIFGVAVIFGLIPFISANFSLPLGIIMIIAALFLFAYGWYLYKSGKPRGTLNVHNQ
jgi:hypothetical protein